MVGGISGPDLKGFTSWAEAIGCPPVDPRSHGGSIVGVVRLEASLAHWSERADLGNERGGLETRHRPQESAASETNLQSPLPQNWKTAS